MSFPRVQLFLDRTQAVRPDFQMTTRNAPAVAKLCQRLEGIPLAIELAAARAHALSPSQILKRFSERFEILRQRRPKKSDRHRSLWAAMEWSYHLLPTELQRFFARLSVFRGGWSLEAAEAVTGSDGVLECWSDAVPTFQHSITPSLHLLEQLRSHSLVLVEEGVPDVRYRMLETLREFAAEQLTPKERAALARRHAHYFLSLAQKAESQLAGREQQAWLERLEAEHDNLRAAFAWTSKNDAETGLRLAAALGQFWEVHGYWSEGREWLEQCLAQNPDAASDLRVDALVWTGRLMLRRGDYQQSIGVLEDALRLSREMDYRRGIANALHNLGAAATYQSNYARARSFYEDSLRLRGEFADVRGMASLLHSLGFVAIQQNDYARARALCGESLTLHRELGDKRGIALSLNVLAAVTQQQGDYTGERAFLAEGLKTAQEIGDKSTVADFLNGLGAVAFFQGDHAQGRVFFEQSLSLRRALGDPRGIAFSLHGLGWLAQAAGDWAQARALHEEGLAIRRALGERRETIQSLCELGDVTLAQGDVTHALSLYAEALRISQELDIKIGFARGLGAMAKIACLQQQWERAARLFGAADALHKTIGAPLPPPFQRDVDKHLATLRQSLDEATFYACWNAGRDMTPQQAVADALNET
jgi:tetratricopeptide (TPR) repeat protein